MNKYTDQEIEMLARFAHEQSGDDVPWIELREARKADMRAYARKKVGEGGMFSHIIRAAARLMREARERGRRDAESQTRSDIAAMHSERDAELDRAVKQARKQGAAEMRERAANLLLDVCHDHPSTREIAANIRSLPLAVPQ